MADGAPGEADYHHTLAAPPNALAQKTMGAGAAVVDHVRDAVSGRTADNPPDPQTH